MFKVFKGFDNKILLTASGSSLLIMPLFVDGVMLSKFLFLVFSSTVLLGHIFATGPNILNQTKVPIFLSLFFIISLSASILESNQSVYESLVGMWGRYNGFLTYVSFTILFVAAALQRLNDFPNKIIQSLVFIGFIETTLGILEVLNISNILYLNKDPFTKITVGNSNFASILLVATFIATTIVLFSKSSYKQYYKNLLFFSILVHVLLIITTRAFQGLLTLIFSIIYLTTFVYFKQKNKFNIRKNIYGPISVVILIFSVLLTARYKIINFDSLYDRFYIWAAGFKMIKDNLLFGVGLDGFGKFFPLYKQEGTIKYEGQLENYDSAHNVFINFAATGGIFTFIFYFLIQGFVLYRVFILLKLKMFTMHLSGLFCIWLVLQLQSLVSIDHLAITVWLWLIGGAIVGASYIEKNTDLGGYQNTSSKFNNITKEKSPPVMIRSGVFVLIFSFCLYIYPTVLSERRVQENVNFYKFFAEQKALNNISQNLVMQSKSVNQSLFNSCFELRSEDLRNYGSLVLFNSGENENAFKLTFDTLERFPRSISARALLGQVYERDGNLELAQKYYLEIMKLDPLNQLFKVKVS